MRNPVTKRMRIKSKTYRTSSKRALRGISIAPFGKRVQADGIPPKPSVTRRWAKGNSY